MTLVRCCTGLLPDTGAMGGELPEEAGSVFIWSPMKTVRRRHQGRPSGRKEVNAQPINLHLRRKPSLEVPWQSAAGLEITLKPQNSLPGDSHWHFSASFR